MGERNTKQKQLIYELIKNTKSHPTADVIYGRARERSPSISLGTVYRVLGNLKESGDIITLETSDKKIHYDGDVSPHSHFVCVKCGKIYDLFVPVCAPNELIKKGFKVDGEKCVYYGACPDCLKNIN